MVRFKKSFFVAMLSIICVWALAGCAPVTNNNIAERISQTENPRIVWGVRNDTRGFGIYDVNEGEIVGFDVDLAKALTEEITDGKGEPVFVEATAKTRIPLLKNGNIDIIAAAMTITEEREKIVSFSDPYFNAGQALLVHEDSHIQNIDDLSSGDTVLAVKGSTSTQVFREARPDVQVIDLESINEAFVALQSGQGDALTSDAAMILGMVQQNPDYRMAGEPFTEEYYGLAVNKNQGEFLSLVNDALQELKDNGTYDQIYEKWFGVSEPTGGE